MEDITIPMIRQLKIDLITDTPNDLIIWFKELWNNIQSIEINSYGEHGLVYYNTNKEIVFYQEYQSDTFWCDVHSYWNYLNEYRDEYPYSINSYIEIQNITEFLLTEVASVNMGMPQRLQYTTALTIKLLLEKVLL